MTQSDNSNIQFTQIADDTLTNGHSLRFRALGSSMTPFIRNGDILTATPTNPNQLRIGEIIFYKTKGGNAIAHRILRIKQANNKLTFNTRGDASTGTYETVEQNQVLGKVTTINRNNKVINPCKFHIRIAGLFWAAIQPLGYILIRIRYQIKSAT